MRNLKDNILEHLKEYKICIYCMGNYGFRTLMICKHQGIHVSYIGDKVKKNCCIEKMECLDFEEVCSLEKDTLIIVANKYPQEIIKMFQEQGFVNVIDCLEIFDYWEKINKEFKLSLSLESILSTKKEFQRIIEQNEIQSQTCLDETKVLYVNYTDLPGRIFNGFDLHESLKEREISAKMLVLQKQSDKNSVIPISRNKDMENQIRAYEREYGISHILTPYGTEILETSEFKAADIVHYHIIHNEVVSLLDYPALMNGKKCVWTIHDPWILMGGCLHPMDCEKWKTGCVDCEHADRLLYVDKTDSTEFMWNIKKQVLKEINPHIIVSSKFMEDYLRNSPFTRHFDKIHKIPFGVDITKYTVSAKESAKCSFKIPKDKIVIGFRAEAFFLKGCKYIYEALERLENKERYFIITVGGANLSGKIKADFDTIELGWVNDDLQMLNFFHAVDIFLMPSLAESFGLMSIEAMAAGCAVICFKDTVLEEITMAPDIGIAVKYCSSQEILEQINGLANNREKMQLLGKMGHELVKEKYQYKDYVRKHLDLYNTILNV